MLDKGWPRLLRTWTNAGLLKETLVVAIMNSVAVRKGNQHPAIATAPMAAITGPIVTPPSLRAPELRGYVHGQLTRRATAESRCIRPNCSPRCPAFGIDPKRSLITMKNPRELVKAKAVTKLFA
jgi:hypothetical protein